MENPISKNGFKPTVKYNNVDDIDKIIYTLTKAGWFGGNPSTAYDCPIDELFNAFYYEMMTRDFEATYFEMNKAKK